MNTIAIYQLLSILHTYLRDEATLQSPNKPSFGFPFSRFSTTLFHLLFHGHGFPMFFSFEFFPTCPMPTTIE